MKIARLIPLTLLLAGCASQHSFYVAERPHTQRDQIIAASNRYPTPGNRDSYSWYQKDTSRNMSVGGNEGGNYYGPSVPQNNSWPSYYAPNLFWP
jgi:hypothetical protein